MSNGCLILPVNAHEYSRSALPKNWCRNCLLGGAYYFFIEMFYLCKILDENIRKTGMNGCPRWERILHYQEHHILRSGILPLVIFLVFLIRHFLCKSIHSRFGGMYQIFQFVWFSVWFHYTILHYFWKIVIFHSFFERWISIWSKDNRNIKN